MSTGLTEQLRERAKLTSRQREQERRQAAADYLDGSSLSAEDWEQRLEQLNWTVSDLEQAGTLLAEQRKRQAERAAGLESQLRLSELQAELDASTKRFDEEIKRLTSEFQTLKNRLMSDIGTNQAAVSRGNDSAAWLRDHMPAAAQDAIDELQAQQRLLLDERLRVVTELSGARTLGTCTKQRRDESATELEAIENELKQVADEIHRAELDALAM